MNLETGYNIQQLYYIKLNAIAMNVEKKKYTHTVKVSTLRILEKNDFNFLKTEKLTGISRSTLRKWKEQFGDIVFSGKSPTEVALKEVDAEMIKNDIKVIAKYYNIRMQIVDRLLDLIPTETRLDHLINTLKSMSEEINNLDVYDKKPNSNILFLDLITEQIKQKKYGNQGPPQ